MMNRHQVAYFLALLIILEKRNALSRGYHDYVLPASQQSELTAPAERRHAMMPQVDVVLTPSNENNTTSDFAGGVNATDDIATAPEQAAARSVQLVPTPVSPQTGNSRRLGEKQRLALNFTTQHNHRDPLGSSAGGNSNNWSSSRSRRSSV